MTKYRFKAKDLKTGNWVEGDLIYARECYHGKPPKFKAMIVETGIHGGMVWISKRYNIDENTIELIIE